MLDSKLLETFIKSMTHSSEIDNNLHEIDRSLFLGYYHLNCMKTYEKGSKQWLVELNYAGDAFHEAGSLMRRLHLALEGSENG